MFYYLGGPNKGEEYRVDHKIPKSGFKLIDTTTKFKAMQFKPGDAMTLGVNWHRVVPDEMTFEEFTTHLGMR